MPRCLSRPRIATATVGFAVVGVLLMLVAPTHAAASAIQGEHFACAAPKATNCRVGYHSTVSYRVLWHNRTATVSGHIETPDERGPANYDYTRVFFESFAGPTEIDSTHRTSSHIDGLGFSFAMGDPNLVGGIDRVKVTVCTYYIDLDRLCGAPVNAMRP